MVTEGLATLKEVGMVRVVGEMVTTIAEERQNGVRRWLTGTSRSELHTCRAGLE